MTFKICPVLGAQGIRAMGFRRAQGNQHWEKFESHTNRVSFETNAIMMIVKVHPLCMYVYTTLKSVLPVATYNISSIVI